MGQVVVISMCFNNYVIFWHQVNSSTIQIFFSPNASTQVANAIVHQLGFKEVDGLGSYLRIFQFHKRVTNSTFQFILDEFKRKINEWDAKLLSMASRATLAKSMLLAIPNYFTQTSLLLIRTCKEIEKLQGILFGGLLMVKRRQP